MNTSVMFSSATDLWATPQQFFNKLNEEFGFTLDPCATPQNAKCANYFTQEIDGLKQDWGGAHSLLQPAIRAGTTQVGTKGLQRKQKAQYHRSNAYTCPDRHNLLS